MIAATVFMTPSQRDAIQLNVRLQLDRGLLAPDSEPGSGGGVLKDG